MKKATLIILILLLAAIGGGGAFLAGWDIPAPTAPVEKVIPNERFQR